MSRDYAYQFLQGDLDRVGYHDPPISDQEQELRLLNGTLNKYLIGVAWHLGGFSVDQINEQWDWGADWGYNQQNNHAPSEALLQVTRIPSALLLATGIVPLFLLGRALGGRPVGYLASLYYALNPALLINGRRAMMEGGLIAFSLLVVLAGVWLLRERRWWSAILLGAAAGLALASKHTAVFTVVAVFAVCAIYPVVEWIREMVRARHVVPLRMWILLLVAVVLALGVFYALNPAWWGDSLGRVGDVLTLRSDLLAGQVAAFGGYGNAGDALGGFFRQVFVNLPQYYESPNWAGYIGDQIARYDGSIWRGVSLGGSLVGGVVLLALTLVGVYALWRDRKSPRVASAGWSACGRWRCWRRRRCSPRSNGSATTFRRIRRSGCWRRMGWCGRFGARGGHEKGHS
ncbi:MAG: glycosyltransferase family 39 protein [Anaerolineae bacterium]